MKDWTRTFGTRHLGTACAALMMTLVAPSHAEEAVGRDITVRYADLAIDTRQGASRLLQRIESAAERVCASLDHGTLATRANAVACRQAVAAAAVSKVNHPLLQALYDSGRGAGAPVVRADR